MDLIDQRILVQKHIFWNNFHLGTSNILVALWFTNFTVYTDKYGMGVNLIYDRGYSPYCFTQSIS